MKHHKPRLSQRLPQGRPPFPPSVTLPIFAAISADPKPWSPEGVPDEKNGEFSWGKNGDFIGFNYEKW